MPYISLLRIVVVFLYLFFSLRGIDDERRTPLFLLLPEGERVILPRIRPVPRKGDDIFSPSFPPLPRRDR